MAAASSVHIPNIQICPPHAAWLVERDEPQLFKPHSRPVTRAWFDGEGDAHTSGLSFQDAEGVTVTHRHEIGRVRRLETPSWAVNDNTLRKLLVFNWERRAHIHDGAGSDRERLEKAHRKMLASIPCLTERLDRMCADLVSNKDPDRRRILINQIRLLDATITHINRGPALTAAVVVYYFRNAMDSCAVALALRVSSAYVRQQIFRLGCDADRMAGKIPARVQKVNGGPKPGQSRSAR
jgi:hypothetical protein